MRVNWSKAAKLDIEGIIAYIADDNISAAIKLKETIFRRVESLSFMPLIGRTGRVSGTREFVVHPNYIIIYAVNDEAITILRILHGKKHYP